MKEQSKVVGWKVYPQYGGWRLDDPKVGVPFLERARKLDVRLICAHKGITFPEVVGAASYGSPVDIGPAAAAFPDLQFLAYHSGYEPNVAEGPYNADRRRRRSARQDGARRQARARQERVRRPRHHVAAADDQPVEAAHVLGKLLVHLGPDNVLWGTDSLWHGTPQGQIEAFRAFEIPRELQDKHGYPALTKELKAKILGLNGARVYGIDPARHALRDHRGRAREAEGRARCRARAPHRLARAAHARRLRGDDPPRARDARCTKRVATQP